MFTSWDMVTEEDKYIASVFKIVSLAFMTPLSNMLLNAREEIADFTFGDAIYLAFAAWIFYLGMIVMFKGAEHVKERRIQEWNHYKL